MLKEVEMGAELRGNPIVGDLLQMNITEKAEKLEEISAVAEKEMQLEESVRDMKAQWDLATFDIRSVGYRRYWMRKGLVEGADLDRTVLPDGLPHSQKSADPHLPVRLHNSGTAPDLVRHLAPVA